MRRTESGRVLVGVGWSRGGGRVGRVVSPSHFNNG